MLKTDTQAQENAIKLFHKASLRVPAYKDFLKKNSIQSTTIKTYKDFAKIPYTDKKNYIDLYSLKDLSWDGDLSHAAVINSSSGTTGNLYYWPCSEDEYQEGAKIHEKIFIENFDISSKNTLVIICFGMGTWIAGMYTFMSTYLLKKKYPLTIMTPGFNKDETLKIFHSIVPQFEQVIVCGIPTFVKDLVEILPYETRKKNQIKFLLAGEGYSPSWHNFILKQINAQKESDVIGILGSAETAIMAYETKNTILIRNKCLTLKKLQEELFQSERIPYLFNYDPIHRFFEKEGEELLVTGDRTIPLIRYNIHDHGGLLSAREVGRSAHNHSIQLSGNISPYIYVFGRGKFTATIYGALIYPENISDVLLDPQLQTMVSGKFVTETKHTRTHDHYLELHVELKKNVKLDKKIALLICDLFMKKVPKINNEYKRILEEYGVKCMPKVLLYPYGHPLLFSETLQKKRS